MEAIVVAVVVFAFTFAGALLGMRLGTILPEHHLDADSKETIKLGIGLIATMTALVLGLVTASAKTSFDAMDAAVKQSAIQVLSLDRLLARYGSDTSEIRVGLQHTIGERIDLIWPTDSSTPAAIDPTSSGYAAGTENLANALRALKPQDDVQRALQARAQDIAENLLEARWGSSTRIGSSVPAPFLMILLFWLTITFTSFGLFAPRNALVITVLFVCALSVASAVFLVLELDGPFDGLIRVSAEPLRFAHRHLNR